MNVPTLNPAIMQQRLDAVSAEYSLAISNLATRCASLRAELHTTMVALEQAKQDLELMAKEQDELKGKPTAGPPLPELPAEPSTKAKK